MQTSPLLYAILSGGGPPDKPHHTPHRRGSATRALAGFLPAPAVLGLAGQALIALMGRKPAPDLD